MWGPRGCGIVKRPAEQSLDQLERSIFTTNEAVPGVQDTRIAALQRVLRSVLLHATLAGALSTQYM